MKDYAIWHPLKVIVNINLPKERYQEREIWWCSIGENVGFEEDGKNALFERPVLVLKKFNSELFIGLPLTTRQKSGRFYYPVEISGVKGNIILSQIRAFSSRRLQRRIEKIGSKTFDQIKDKLFIILS